MIYVVFFIIYLALAAGALVSSIAEFANGVYYTSLMMLIVCALSCVAAVEFGKLM